MKKTILCMMLFCGLAIISTGCKKDSENVKPETEVGSMVVGTQTLNINTADAVSYGNRNAIVLANKSMTEAGNEGVAVIFDGNIVPGTYSAGGTDSKATAPRVVGLKNFNMGELPFVIEADSLYFGEAYLWLSGELSITEANGTYTVILSECAASGAGDANISLAVNFNGTLEPFALSTGNRFVVDGVESPIGLAGITTISGMSSLGTTQGVTSMLFLSANHKRAFIVSYIGNGTLEGEYPLGYFITPYLPTMPCVHVALDSDFWTMQPQTGYVAKSGTLRVTANADGTKTVVISNLKLKNLEHESELFWPLLDGELEYHGYMYEIE